MKIIGLIGYMSCASTAAYCRIINEAIRENLGGRGLPGPLFDTTAIHAKTGVEYVFSD